MSSQLNGVASDLSDARASRAELSPEVPCHQALDLTKGGTLAGIELNGQVYALRITRQGRLILTK